MTDRPRNRRWRLRGARRRAGIRRPHGAQEARL